MAQYFFKMNREEKDNILDQHKQLYDGYSTHYNQESNMTPLWVQDFANDKAGITGNNKGVVSNYKNMGINESSLDMIGDGPNDLANGTVDLDDSEYISLGRDMNLNKNEFDYDIDGLFDDDDDDDDDDNDDNYYNDDEVSNSYVNDDDDESNLWEELNIIDDVDEDILPDFIEKLNESIDMFERFKKYN
jgi:hypothetical protein